VARPSPDPRPGAISRVVAVVGSSEALRSAVAATAAQQGLRVAASAATPTALGFDHDADAVIVALDESVDAGKWIRAIRAGAVGVRVVVVGTFTNHRVVRELIDQGAAGLVAAADLEEALAPTLEAVCAGQTVFPRELRSYLWRPLLSTREKQILGMVVLGFSNSEIASKLVIAETTVKSHLSSSFRKLGVRSRAEVTELILDSERGLGTGILAISEGNGSFELHEAVR
jgi:DNA-binding NarL/FixJ family response regulator